MELRKPVKCNVGAVANLILKVVHSFEFVHSVIRVKIIVTKMSSNNKQTALKSTCHLQSKAPK